MNIINKIYNKAYFFLMRNRLDRGNFEAVRSRKFLLGDCMSDCQVNIGRWTYVDPHSRAHIWTKNDKISIGKFCSIAGDVKIIAGGNHDHNSRVSTYPFKSKLTGLNLVESGNKGPVVIGNDVWIGIGATILSGVKIGDGSIIGAQAVISRDVPPYSIAVGNPAKIVRQRFESDIIEKLLQIKWWDWDDDLIKERMGDFYLDAEAFVKKYSNI